MQGIEPEQAFYVTAGLNQTITALDILEGRLIVEVSMAPTRPAEFVIIRITLEMVSS